MSGQSSNHHQQGNSWPIWLKYLIVLILLPLSTTFLVMIVRHQGWLQRYELKAFDLLTYLKGSLIYLTGKDEPPDSRILIVTIDDKDSDYLKNNLKNILKKRLDNLEDPVSLKKRLDDLEADLKSPDTSLPDEAFTELLTKLDRLNGNKNQKLIIGSDIYHPKSFQDELAERLKNNYRFFVVCQIPSSENSEKVKNISPPSNIPSEESWGFSNVLLDKDRVVRRHFLARRPHPTADCSTAFSLNYLLAYHYLDDLGIKITRTKEGDLQFQGKILTSDRVVFRKLTSHSSGYQGLDAKGDQILLNYRYNCSQGNCSLKNVAKHIPLQNVLKYGVRDEIAKKPDDSPIMPIILIGVTETKKFTSDFFNTPNGEEIPGVFLHAQMLSQILSGVLDDRPRPLIGWWSIRAETLWVFVWAFLGTISGFLINNRNRKRMYLILAVSLAIGAQFIFSLFMFVEAFKWIPLFPAVLVFLVTVLPLAYFGDDIPKIVIAFLQEIIPWVKGIVEAIKASHNNKD